MKQLVERPRRSRRKRIGDVRLDQADPALRHRCPQRFVREGEIVAGGDLVGILAAPLCVSGALRPGRQRHGRPGSRRCHDRRFHKPRVEPEAGDAGIDHGLGQAQVALPEGHLLAERIHPAVTEHCRGAEEGGEVRLVELHPDRARLWRGNVLAVRRSTLAVKGRDAEGLQAVEDLVIVLLVGAVGRPEGVRLIECRNQLVARGPVGVEKVVRGMRPVEHQRHVDLERRCERTAGRQRAVPLIAGQIEIGGLRERDIGFGGHRSLLPIPGA